MPNLVPLAPDITVTGGGGDTLLEFLADINALADPNVDAIPFWDDSADFGDWLLIGTGLEIADKTLKLTAAAIASLALADSALQPGDNVSELVNDAGYITSSSLPTTEQIQDIVGAMVTGNTESGITVTYQDADGTIDFELAAGLVQIGALVDPNADRILFWDDSLSTYAYLSVGTGLSLSGTTLTSTITQYTDEMVDDRVATLLVEGTGIDLAYNDVANTLTITVDLSELSTTTLPEGTNLYFTNERVDDRVAALIQNGTGITWTYDDIANTLTPAVTITQYTDEQAQDAVGTILTNGGGLTWTYNDTGPTISAVVSITSSSVTDFAEAAQDAIGTILTDSSQIDFTYNDAGGTITATIINDSITNSHLANMVQSTIKGRAALAGTGDPTDLTAAQVRTIINVEDGATADQTAAEILAALITVDGAGSGLDADLLDGQSSAFHLARANHTGTQVAATISDLAESVADIVGAMLTGNTETGITVTYQDADNTIDFVVSITSSSVTDFNEAAQDAVGSIFVDSAQIDFTYNDVTPSITGTIINDSITNAHLRNSAALSVIGNATNATADPADIAAGTDHQVLRRSGTAIGFGAINLAQAAAVTGTLGTANGGLGAVLADPNADRIIFWDDSLSTHAYLTVSTGLSLSGTTLTSTITQYTDELAQDAIGGILLNGGGLTWTYNDTTPSISAVVSIASSSVTDFAEAVDDRVSSLLVAGAQITLTYNDVANTLTIASTASGGGPSLGTDSIIRTNAKIISENITFAGTENGSTVGPVEIDDTYTVDITTGSRWVIL